MAHLAASGQSELGVRATPLITAQPKVINPLTANIYSQNRISFEGGLDYTRYFTNKPFGIRVGTAIGIVDHIHVLRAPRNAFGMMT